LEIYLSSGDYQIYKAYSGLEALEVMKNESIHLVLMDIMMPHMDGIRATQEIRKTSNVPVLFLTAKGEDMDKIAGLNAGADDYITKPFNPLEVLARVRSQLRRYTVLGGDPRQEGTLSVGPIVLDRESHGVTVDGQWVSLTPLEYNILRLLMSKPGQVFSVQEIYERVWNDPVLGSENTVAVHIRHLREKLEIDPSHPRYLKVVWGVGYKIDRGSL
jgi:DNA-binding response OmpR family regulator